MRKLKVEFGTKDIREITTWQIEKYKAKRKEEIKRPGMVRGFYKEIGKDGVEEETWYGEHGGEEEKKVRKAFGSDQRPAQALFTGSNETIRSASVNRELALLKHMDSKAVEWSKVRENPAKRAKILKGEVKRKRFLLPAEIQRLLSNSADHRKPIGAIPHQWKRPQGSRP